MLEEDSTDELDSGLEDDLEDEDLKIHFSGQ